MSHFEKPETRSLGGYQRVPFFPLKSIIQDPGPYSGPRDHRAKITFFGENSATPLHKNFQNDEKHQGKAFPAIWSDFYNSRKRITFEFALRTLTGHSDACVLLAFAKSNA